MIDTTWNPPNMPETRTEMGTEVRTPPTWQRAWLLLEAGKTINT
jgi:hypothetical protein